MGVCDVPVISTVCDTAGEAAASLISAPFDWLAQAMGEAAAWLFESVWTVFDTTTLVDVQRPEYVEVYNLVFGIAAFLMLLFFCFQLITAMIRREPGGLSRAALGLAKSVLGSFVVITVTALALEIVDQLCVGIIQAAGETTESLGDKIAALVVGLTALNMGAPGVAAILTIFLAGLAIAAAAIVWLSLLVRKALLLVTIALAPLAFSGASWDASRGWISKWAMFVIALVLSKLVLVVILLVAVTQVAAPIDGDLASVSDPLAGIVLMAIAGFAPYMTYKFLSFMGFDLYHAMGAEQEAKQALNRPVPTPGKPGGDQPKKVLDGGKDGGGPGDGGGGGGGGGGPKQSPTRGYSHRIEHRDRRHQRRRHGWHRGSSGPRRGGGHRRGGRQEGRHLGTEGRPGRGRAGRERLRWRRPERPEQPGRPDPGLPAAVLAASSAPAAAADQSDSAGWRRIGSDALGEGVGHVRE